MCHKLSLIVWMMLLAPISEAEANSAQYYCPKGGGILNIDDIGMRGSGYEFGKYAESSAANATDSPLRNWVFSSCSSAIFRCVDAVLSGSKTTEALRIFAPRALVVNRTYEYGKAKARSLGSTLRNHHPTAELIIWQTLAERNVAIKLTIQQDRGVIFIHGINFQVPDDYEHGESCALVSPKGLFSSVQVEPYSSGQPVQ